MNKKTVGKMELTRDLENTGHILVQCRLTDCQGKD